MSWRSPRDMPRAASACRARRWPAYQSLLIWWCSSRRRGMPDRHDPDGSVRRALAARPFFNGVEFMADNEQHRARLQELNRNYVRSVDEADVAWFDANLAPEFFNTNPDGSLIDRTAFLAQIGRGSSVKNIREHDVLIRIL